MQADKFDVCDTANDTDNTEDTAGDGNEDVELDDQGGEEKSEDDKRGGPSRSREVSLNVEMVAHMKISPIGDVLSRLNKNGGALLMLHRGFAVCFAHIPHAGEANRVPFAWWHIVHGTKSTLYSVWSVHCVCSLPHQLSANTQS